MEHARYFEDDLDEVEFELGEVDDGERMPVRRDTPLKYGLIGILVVCLTLIPTLQNSTVDVKMSGLEEPKHIQFRFERIEKVLEAEVQRASNEASAKYNENDIKWIMSNIHKVTGEELESKLENLEIVLRSRPELVETVINSNTLVHYATCLVFKNGRQMEVLKTLIKYGANVNTMDGKYATPLHSIVYFNYFAIDLIEIIKLLVIEGADVDAADVFGRTFLHLAAWKTEPDVFHEIVEFLVSINNVRLFKATDQSGETILHFATNFVDLRVKTMELLSIYGADFKAVNIHGMNVLNSAITKNRSDLFLGSLIRFGADYNVRNYIQQTPLHVAASIGNFKAVKLFIQLGIDVNSIDTMKLTPLFYSLVRSKESSYFEISKFLLNNGADVDYVTVWGINLIDVAKERLQSGEVGDHILQLLENHSKIPTFFVHTLE